MYWFCAWGYCELLFVGPWDGGGGAKRMGGGKRTRERALPKIFGPLQKSLLFWSALWWIFVQKKKATDTWEAWKTYRTREGPRPLFGRRVIREVFQPPAFFPPPPHCVLWLRGLTSYRGAEPPNPEKCSRACLATFAPFSATLGVLGEVLVLLFLAPETGPEHPPKHLPQHPPPWRPLSLGILPHSWALLQVYLVPSWPKLLQNIFLGAFSFRVVIVTKISTKGIISKELLIVIIPLELFFL